MANISKIHLPDESILGLRASGILIGRTNSTSTATVQTATVPGLTELFDGMFMFIYNSTIASASGWTLNINGLGAKQVYNSQNARTTTGFSKNTWFPLIYDGVNDRFVIGYITDNNTTYSNASLGQGYGTCATAAATAAKVVSLSSYALTVNGIVAVKFTNDVPANATMNINSKGAKAIYHRGAAITDGVIKGGDTAYFIYNTYYHLLGVDRIPASSPFISGTGPYSAMLKPEDDGDIEASGNYSVAEGAYTTAAGNYSHAEGMATQANGVYSHAEGRATSAENDYEHAQGRFNVSNKTSTTFGDAGNTIHSIGIGTSTSNKKNALEIMQNGDAYLYGVGEYDGTTITGKTTLQNVISNKQDELVSGTNIKTVNNNSLLGSGNISVGTVTGSSLTANNIILGNDSSAIKSSGKTIATTLGTDDTTVPTSKAVKDAIDALPEPMIFQGTLGTGGTITSLPAAAAANTGYTYKVITNGTYQSITAKAGDTFVSNGSSWTLIPSGDEPSGTVTNIATGTGLTGGPITTTGTISIDTTTVAMKSDIPTTLDQIADGSTRKLSDYLPLTGGDMKSGAYIKLNSSVAENEIYSSYIHIHNKNTNAYAEYDSSNFLYSPDGNDEYTIRFPQNDGTIALTSDINTAVSGKQDTLVSGTNIKTVNGASLLGSGDIQVDGLKTLTMPLFFDNVGDKIFISGTKEGAATELGITEAQLDSLINGEYDCLIFEYFGVSTVAYKMLSMPSMRAIGYVLYFGSPFEPQSLGIYYDDEEEIPGYYYDYAYVRQDISGKEDVSNKVTSLSSSSTDTQYPSAKATYDAISAVTTESLTTAEIDTIWNNAS